MGQQSELINAYDAAQCSSALDVERWVRPGVYCVIDDLKPEKDFLVVMYLNALHSAGVPVRLLSGQSFDRSHVPSHDPKEPPVEVPSPAYQHASDLGLRLALLSNIRPISEVFDQMALDECPLQELVAGQCYGLSAMSFHDPQDFVFREKIDSFLHPEPRRPARKLSFK